MKAAESTKTPELLVEAGLFPPLLGPTLVIVPLLSRKSAAPVLVAAQPTICPLSLIASAAAESPPRVPRSVAVPFCQRTAWSLLLVSSQVPTIWLLLLIAPAPQLIGVKLLGSGSCVVLPLLSRQACWPGFGPHVPAIWPRSLIPVALKAPRSSIVLPFQRNPSGT